MKVLGLDLSLTSTGVALITSGHLHDFGTIKTGDLRGPERLSWIRNRVGGWLLEAEPDLVGIEGYSYGAAMQAHPVGELGGVIRLLLHDDGIPFVVIPPTTWRKDVLGKGNIDKTQVRMEVFKRYGVEIPSHDALEAFCVAQAAYLQAIGETKPRVVRKKKAAA